MEEDICNLTRQTSSCGNSNFGFEDLPFKCDECFFEAEFDEVFDGFLCDLVSFFVFLSVLTQYSLRNIMQHHALISCSYKRLITVQFCLIDLSDPYLA